MKTNWTREDIPTLTGKVIIVTGANSGVGYEATREFARKGAQVILACRNMEKAQDSIGLIQQEIPDAKLEFLRLELANLASVRKFAEAFKKSYRKLDVLVNNAGIMWAPYRKTDDGFESQFGINHLGHFALIGLLFDTLTKTPGARVVNVSSVAHRFAAMDFDNLMFRNGNGYSRNIAYSNSKLANLLFTYELNSRFEINNIDAIAVAAHPGTSNTNLTHHVEDQIWYRLLHPLAQIFAQSSAMGALPIIRAAVDENVRGGEYYGPDGFMESRGYPVLVRASEASRNQANARRLWEISEELTGVHYPV